MENPKKEYVLKEVCEEKTRRIENKILWVEQEMYTLRHRLDKIFYALIAMLASLITNLVIQLVK